MYATILLTLLVSCAPPAEQRDLSYASAPRVSIPVGPPQEGHISTEEISAMRVKVRRMREDTEAMRQDLHTLTTKLYSDR